MSILPQCADRSFEEDSFPKVGDVVTYSEVSEGKAVIEEIIPRTSTISRKAVGTGGEQVIVANADIVFIVMGLDGDFNLSRLERYLLLARQSNVKPVIILNKRDSVNDPESFVRQTREIARGVSVHAVSATTGENMETLLKHLGADTTAVLLGSSGAGKSTITNWLLREEKQPVQDVRIDDSHGKHTTTSRQLFTLPRGGFLIDTPGIRELGVQSTEEDEEAVFARFDVLRMQCRFPNCDHEKSKGCAILEAVEAGEIEERLFKNFQKLQRERFFEESKHDVETSRDYKQKQKNLHKATVKHKNVIALENFLLGENEKTASGQRRRDSSRCHPFADTQKCSWTWLTRFSHPKTHSKPGSAIRALPTQAVRAACFPLKKISACRRYFQRAGGLGVEP